MLHLVVGASSVTNNSTFATVGRLIDNFFTDVNSGYQRQDSWKANAIYARIPDGSAARLYSSTLRLPIYPNLVVLDTAADPPNLPPVNVYGDNGPILPALDPWNMQVSRAGAGAAVCAYGIVCSDVPISPARGEVRTIFATTTLTGSTSAWVQSNLTLSDQLPPGQYDVVGMAVYGTNCLFGRLIFPDKTNRPGVLAQQSVSEYSWDFFRNGNMGTWGTFDQQALPSFEALHYGAGSNPTVAIDVIKR